MMIMCLIRVILLVKNKVINESGKIFFLQIME